VDLETAYKHELKDADVQSKKSRKRVWEVIEAIEAKDPQGQIFQPSSDAVVNIPTKLDGWQFLVRWRDERYRSRPEWIPAANVGKPIVESFRRLLRFYPLFKNSICSLGTINLESLKVLADHLRLEICSRIQESLHHLGLQRAPDNTLSVTFFVNIDVFLLVFGNTRSFKGDTATALLGMQHSSRTISFVELVDALTSASLQQSGQAWHKRIHLYGHSSALNRGKSGRLSIRLMNGIGYDHSDCPRCTFQGEALLEQPGTCKFLRVAQSFGWEGRLTWTVDNRSPKATRNAETAPSVAQEEELAATLQ